MLEYGENEEARFLLDKCRSSINAMKELKPAEKNIITPLLERLQKLEEQYQNSLDDLEAEQNYDKIRGPQPLPGRRGNYPCVEKELLKVTSSRKNLQIIEWEKVYPERDHWSVVVKYMEGRGKSRKKSRMKVDFQTRDGVTCYLIKTSDLY